jgi:mannose-6-phosphate isomerase-like protein (cupin superfamily)
MAGGFLDKNLSNAEFLDGRIADGKPFATMQLPAQRTVVAADGSDVRVLLALKGGSMAHFSLQAGQTASAVTHRTVEEVWYVVQGQGEMWRKQGSVEEAVVLIPGVCLTIPLGTHFQFRAATDQPLGAVCVTMPPWPTDPAADEAVPVAGPWTATAL